METEKARNGNSILYGIARGFAWLMLRVLMPVRYHGKEKLSRQKGSFVLISNHLHALDPLILAYPIPEQCVFLGKKELGKNPVAAKVLNRLNCILVDRHNMDMEAMRACMKAIRAGKPLVIFPEGTRHHEGQMEQIENGTSLMVLRSGVPLIPVYLDRPMKFFRRSNAYVGDPIPYEDLREQGVNRESSEALNERMRETYRRMVSEYGSFS